MHREDLVYKEECYKIVGILYQVFKELDSELLEKHYQYKRIVNLQTPI